jgi:vacuolar-type H+-ATPase subunit H
VLGGLRRQIDRNNELLEANRREREEMREFMREMNIRYERSFQLVAKRLEDMGDQIRANTAATWAMVDEIRGTSR